MKAGSRDVSASDVGEISALILGYLSEKDGLEDTVEGVVSWLVFRQKLVADQSQKIIDAAIEQLLQQHAIEAIHLNDGRMIIKSKSIAAGG